MSILKTVTHEEATGGIKELYDEIMETLGRLPDVMKLLSVNSHVLEMFWKSTKEVLMMEIEDKKLHLTLRALVATKNDCEYCMKSYRPLVKELYEINEEELNEIVKDPSKAPLELAHKELLLFALKAIENPHSAETTEVRKLEELGFTQKEIFDAVHTTAYMSVINIINDTFKIEVNF